MTAGAIALGDFVFVTVQAQPGPGGGGRRYGKKIYA
jgi:hypothetical protein